MTEPRGSRCPTIIVVTGVSGAGKTTVGRALAADLGRAFHDADDFHPVTNVAKMRRGEPLTDADRTPWLAALAALIAGLAADRVPAVLACSALRRAYRAALVPPDARPGEVAFVHLEIGPALAEARLASRGGHFMPVALVASQFATLEAPDDAVRLDATLPVSAIVRHARAALGC